MAAFVAFILAATATAAEIPRKAPPAVSASAVATVTVIRAERVNTLDEPDSVARSVRRERGKIAVDFH